jgi:hypothetical protein
VRVEPLDVQNHQVLERVEHTLQKIYYSFAKMIVEEKDNCIATFRLYARVKVICKEKWRMVTCSSGAYFLSGWSK